MISKCHDPFYDISRIGGTKTLTTTTHKIDKQLGLRTSMSFTSARHQLYLLPVKTTRWLLQVHTASASQTTENPEDHEYNRG